MDGVHPLYLAQNDFVRVPHHEATWHASIMHGDLYRLDTMHILCRASGGMVMQILKCRAWRSIVVQSL